MMTHKNREGTFISVELLNSVNVDRSRSRSSNSSATSLIVKDSSNKSNFSDDFNPLGHHLPPPTPPPSTGQQSDPSRRAPTNNLAAMMSIASRWPSITATIATYQGHHQGSVRSTSWKIWISTTLVFSPKNGESSIGKLIEKRLHLSLLTNAASQIALNVCGLCNGSLFHAG